MRVRVAVVAVAIAATAADGAAPTVTELYVRGELAELRRRASREPVAELVHHAAARDRATALAAITAIASHPDAIDALTALATIAGGWDRSRAATAATAARAIAASLDGDRAIHDDLDDDALASAADAWLAIADRRDRWSDVRDDALTVAVALTQARAATAEAPPAVAALLAPAYEDPDPRVRQAALEATPAPIPAELIAAATVRLATDQVAALRLIAGQTLCAGDAAAAIAAADDTARAALRAIAATAAPTHPGALLDVARCLAADPAPESARALAALRARAPRSLRAPLAALARRRP